MQLAVVGGSIPVKASFFTDNMAARALTSGPVNLGNNTRGEAPTALYSNSVRAPAIMGKWYEIPDGQCIGYAHFNSVSVKWFTSRLREVNPDDIDVKYDLVDPLNNLMVGGQPIELTNVRIRLTKATAEGLFDNGFVTIDELDKILSGDVKDPPPPFGWPDALNTLGIGLVAVSLAATAIYFARKL